MEREREEAITSSRTFSVKITAPAASSANATANTSDWKMTCTLLELNKT
jgi:hypothetical protein